MQSGIALARADLAATALTPGDGAVLTDNLQYALAPQLSGLKARFDANRLAILLNVGPLIQPTTLAQYESANRAANPLPPRLFSHNDQQSLWQSDGDERSTHGWGGRLGDLALSSGPSNSQLTCISASSNAVFVAGQDAIPVPGQPERCDPHQGARRTAAQRSEDHHHAQQQPCPGKRMRRRHAALDRTRGPGQYRAARCDADNRIPDGNLLAKQMRVVARMIGANATFGVKRQVFFVSFCDFDHHKSLMGQHPRLMTQLDGALSAFYSATVELGVADKVTTFTASDFGRTLASNADGSDHGWGSHHFVMGGAVNGGRFYGTAPHVSTSDR